LQKASLRDLYNLSVISGLRNGPKLIMASALDGMLSSPKVKVKGKDKVHGLMVADHGL